MISENISSRKKAIISTLLAILVLSSLSAIGGNSVIKHASAFNLECSGSFATSNLPIKYYIDSSNGAEGKAAIKDALSLWSDSPVAVSFTSSSTSYQILFRSANTGSGNAQLYTTYPSCPVTTSQE